MFPMTVTIHTAKQLNAVLAAMQPELQASDFASPEVGAAYVEASARVAEHDKAAKEPKAGKPSPAPTVDSPRTAEAAKADAQKPKAENSAPATSVDAPAPTYDHVKTAILDVSKSKGREAALKLLAQFGAEKGPDLQKTPEKFSEFIAAAKKLLGA